MIEDSYCLYSVRGRYFLVFDHDQVVAIVVHEREEVRTSRQELAKRSGIPLPLLTRIENGTASSSSFGLDEICKISEAVKLHPYMLMATYERFVKELGVEFGTRKKPK